MSDNSGVGIAVTHDMKPVPTQGIICYSELDRILGRLGFVDTGYKNRVKYSTCQTCEARVEHNRQVVEVHLRKCTRHKYHGCTLEKVEPAFKKQKANAIPAKTYSFESLYTIPLTLEQINKAIEQFWAKLTRAFIYCNIPFRVMDDPSFRELFVPDCQIGEAIANNLPTSKLLRTELVPGQIKLAQQRMEDILDLVRIVTRDTIGSERFLTVACNSWEKVNSVSMFASVAHLPNGLPLPYYWKEKTGKSRNQQAAIKNLEYLITLRKEDILALVAKSVQVYLFAKNHLATFYPWIIFLPCFALQANLVIKDHVSLLPYASRAIDYCQTICQFFNNRSRRAIYDQERYEGATALQKMSATSWDSAFTMVDSVVKNWNTVRRALRCIADTSSPNPEINKKAEQLHKLGTKQFCWYIGDFRHWLKEMTRIQDLLQRDGARLYSILPAFISLYQSTVKFYNQVEAPTANLTSVYNKQMNKYWPIQTLIVAMVLHPGMKSSLLRLEDAGGISYHDLSAMVVAEASRLLGASAVRDIEEVFQQYRWNSYPFCQLTKKIASHKDYIMYWQTVKNDYKQNACLADLALRLGLVNCNAASVEKLFSQVKQVQPRGRSQLNNDMAFGMSIVRILEQQFGDFGVELAKEAVDRILQFDNSQPEPIQLDEIDIGEYEGAQHCSDSDNPFKGEKFTPLVKDLIFSQDEDGVEYENQTSIKTFDGICNLEHQDLPSVLDGVIY